MPAWDRETAGEEISRLLDEGLSLELDSAAHTSWVLQVDAFLRSVFGTNSEYYKRFKALSWEARKGIVGGPGRPAEVYDPSLGIERLRREGFARDREAARGILLAAQRFLDQLELPSNLTLTPAMILGRGEAVDDTSTVRRREAARRRLLAVVYDAVGGSSRRCVDGLTELAESKGIARHEIDDASHWLYEHGFLEVYLQNDAVALTPLGVSQAETWLTGGQDHSPLAHPGATSSLTIHGNVGSVIAGSGNTAHVKQYVEVSPREVVELLRDVREHLSELPAEQRDEAIELVDVVEAEAGLSHPSKRRLRALLGGCRDFLLNAGANVAGNLIAAWLRGR